MAHELGFVAVGVAEAAPASSTPVFEAWLDSGRAAGLHFLTKQREIRRDPRHLLPEARSVVCVAAAYPSHPHPGTGFAMHARAQDYHAVMRSRLRTLADALRRRIPDLRARIAVDSAPLFEREWAVRAGLGWIGRQGQVISPTHGATVLLGELLLNVSLTPTAPVPSRCGDCRRCVEACPTGAIGSDGLLDARRCVSYLTIEHSGQIPAELAERMPPALFGCDCCTAACPWNQQNATGVLPELQPREMPTAGEILAMDAAAFRRRFRGTAVLRSGLERLQRNARLAVRHEPGSRAPSSPWAGGIARRYSRM